MRKPTKRKIYQKRRKKEKAEQRKKMQPPTPALKATKASTYKCGNNHSQQYHRNQNNFFNTFDNHYTSVNPCTTYTKGLQLWWLTYCTAIQFHAKQQNMYNEQRDNMGILHVTERYLKLLEKYANEYETSSEEEDDTIGTSYLSEYCSEEENISDHGTAAEGVDDDYFRFLEITYKHKEELRIKKAKEY